MSNYKTKKSNPTINISRTFLNTEKLEDKLYKLILNALPEKAV